MLPTISLLVLLLTSSFATATPSSSANTTSSSPSKDNDNTQQRTGCHDRINTNSETLVFHNGQQTTFEYKIVTQYKKYYPKLLEYALRSNDFEMIKWRSDQSCGWQKADSVYGRLGLDSANHRGDVY